MAQLLAGPVHAAAEHLRVRPREIDQLEDALAAALRRQLLHGAHARGIGHHHLAGLDLPLELRLDQVERAGLAGEHRGTAQLAHHQRPEAERVAHGDDRVRGEEQERVGAAHLREGLLDALSRGALALAGDEVQEQLGIGGALEDRALRLQGGAQLLRVDEVAVVRHRDRPGRALEHERLGVLDERLAGRGIARVADRCFARHAGERRGVEVVGDQPHGLVDLDLAGLERGDACRLLPAVLQSVDAQVGDVRRLRVAEDAEHATFVVELVVVDRVAKDLQLHGVSQGRGTKGTGLALVLQRCQNTPQRRVLPGGQNSSPAPGAAAWQATFCPRLPAVSIGACRTKRRRGSSRRA